MKAVILAGGLGTRLVKKLILSQSRCKDVGNRCCGIFSSYSVHGITDFVVCLGYKGYVIRIYIELHASH